MLPLLQIPPTDLTVVLAGLPNMSKNHSPAFLKLVEDAKSRITEIDAQDLPALLDADKGATLIDVREESEFAAAHVEGAVWLGKGIIERDVEAKFSDLDTPLYLYCGGGFRSALAADALQNMGYANVVSVDGGWRELKEIMPVSAK